jgi:hypothetical protein
MRMIDSKTEKRLKCPYSVTVQLFCSVTTLRSLETQTTRLLGLSMKSRPATGRHSVRPWDVGLITVYNFYLSSSFPLCFMLSVCSSPSAYIPSSSELISNEKCWQFPVWNMKLVLLLLYFWVYFGYINMGVVLKAWYIRGIHILLLVKTRLVLRR